MRLPARLRSAVLLGLSLLACWSMAVSVSPHIGVTGDEIAHLTGGYTYWKFNDYRMHPDNGTLPQRLAALPLLGLAPTFPALDSPFWLRSETSRVGHDFFYSSGNDPDQLLRLGRMTIALLGTLVIGLTWRWARKLFGPAAGWIALGFAGFCPALLAQGGLVTSDLAAALGLLLVVTAYWRVLHVVSWPRLLAAALAGGAVLLAKMSGVLVLPVLALLLAARWLRPAPLVLRLGRGPRWLRGRPAVIAATAAAGLGLALASLALVWAGYGFRYAAPNLARSRFERFDFDWPFLLGRAPPPGRGAAALVSRLAERLPAPAPSRMGAMVGWARDHRLLPEAYLWGFLNAYRGAQSRAAFLDGDHRLTGWPRFFPLAFLYKTTLPALALGLLALGLAVTGRLGPARRWLWRAAPLLALATVYWAFAVTSKLNIGHRHLLPVYPVFYVFVGGAGAWLLRQRSRVALVALAAAGALHAADSLSARPFYLSYFNPLGGGHEGGWRHLVDSSFDWGQGLPALGDWLAARRAAGDTRPVYLTYFGADDPRWRGLAVTRFADEIGDHGPRVHPVYPQGGWFVISATHFQRIYLNLAGPWTPAREQLYADARSALARWAARPPATDREQEIMRRDARDFELLEFGRLCHFLENRAPDAVVGGSLLVFRLSNRETAFALHAPLAIVDRALAVPPPP